MSVLKSRDIALPTKIHIVKAMVFPVVIHGCENWTIKKADHQRTDALEMWCWRRLLRVPWTARRSNKSTIKQINPVFSLKGLRVGVEEDRGWNGWLASPTQWIWVWVNPRSWWWTGRPGMLLSMGSQRVRPTELLNWTELNLIMQRTSELQNLST